MTPALVYAVIKYRRELIAQKLDDSGIHLYVRKFCSRPTSQVSASEQSRCSALVVERAVLMKIRSVYTRYKRSRNGGRDDVLLKCNIRH